jgi:hypothetical protein
MIQKLHPNYVFLRTLFRYVDEYEKETEGFPPSMNNLNHFVHWVFNKLTHGG